MAKLRHELRGAGTTTMDYRRRSCSDEWDSSVAAAGGGRGVGGVRMEASRYVFRGHGHEMTSDILATHAP